MYAVGMIIAVIGLLLLAFLWSLARMAAISDERMKRMIEKEKR